MPLLRSPTWMRIKRRKALLAHCPMTMMVPGHTFYRQSSMANPDCMQWVTTSLCEHPSFSYPKESVPALSELVVICEAIVFLKSSTQTVFTGVSRVVPEYESNRMMIYAHIRTGQMVVAVRHCVTVVFLTPFFYVQNIRKTLSARWRIPLLQEISLRFL